MIRIHTGNIIILSNNKECEIEDFLCIIRKREIKLHSTKVKIAKTRKSRNKIANVFCSTFVAFRIDYASVFNFLENIARPAHISDESYISNIAFRRSSYRLTQIYFNLILFRRNFSLKLDPMANILVMVMIHNEDFLINCF